MLSSLVKEHQAKQGERKEQQGVLHFNLSDLFKGL